MVTEKIFKTAKRPYYFYIVVVLWACAFGIFCIELEGTTTSIYYEKSILFLTVTTFVYVLFGRYLATISLSKYCIRIDYVFPWNKGIEFQFETLKEIDFKEYEILDRVTTRWYRGGKRLYLKDEKGKVCQFKYNINPLDNQRLLNELQQKCVSGITFS
ncbi:hypothetical protein [Phnomibacter ginsenosidimutans]|uniref:Uncharacterized protein n=1 Tax=Phnomibacter ginsenosidimutans TaxID=2676868 RepID=A0A6I6G2C7_9BACT|nr:hypothetical protein [Phnomibacter ginsenosidimutans]QGW26746.1 hypothetical protein GLV81_00275 [Phnomibacter ginsenosidimutans]